MERTGKDLDAKEAAHTVRVVFPVRGHPRVLLLLATPIEAVWTSVPLGTAARTHQLLVALNGHVASRGSGNACCHLPTPAMLCVERCPWGSYDNAPVGLPGVRLE